LLDVPVDVARADDPAANVLARGERVDVLAERRVGADLEGARLDRLGEALFLALVGGAREVVAQLLELRVGRPAEPRLLARGADRGVRERIPDVGRHPGGAEDVPAA